MVDNNEAVTFPANAGARHAEFIEQRKGHLTNVLHEGGWDNGARCPICEGEEWLTFDEPVTLIADGQPPVPGRFEVPCLFRICQHCSFLRLHAIHPSTV